MDLAAAISTDPTSLSALSNLREEPCPDLSILTAKVKLTWRCNLSCVFCSLPEPRSTMPRVTALRLGRELSSQGLRKVHFSGGEALTHPECFGILSDWANLGLQVNLTSNGTLMGKEEVRLLESSGVHCVSLSVDSADRRVHDKLRGKKGAHKAVIRAAERIAERGRMKLRINTVVTSRNIAGLAALRELVRGFGRDISWKIIPVDPVRKSLSPSPRILGETAAEIREWPELEDPVPFGSTPEQYEETSRGRHGFRPGLCYVPWFHLFFAPDGACYPCCMARGITRPLGAYPAESVREIITGQPMREFRASIASARRPGACAFCDDFLEESRIIADLIAAAEAQGT